MTGPIGEGRLAVRIARFVDMKACESIFSDCSTFVLRSSEHYRRLYETDRIDEPEKQNQRGDESELEVRLAGGGSAEVSGFVLSCWTMLDGDEPTPKEWNIFPDSVVAIVSTPDKVCKFLEKAFRIGEVKGPCRRRYPIICVEHKAVTYADEVAEEITPENIMDITPFTKRLRFEEQKEYRFAVAYSPALHLLDTYTFISMHPGDYMDTCFVNPAMCAQDKNKLYLILMNAMCRYGPFENKSLREIIANADVLFCK